MIVITGASDGIGEALARKFSQTEKVMMLARNEEKLKIISEETGAEYIVRDVPFHNIVSQAGIKAKANRSIYDASEWAVTGFTKAIEEEAVAYGVRVTGIYPATVQTKLFEKAGLPINTSAMSTDDLVAAVEYAMAQPEHMYISHLEMRPI